MNINMTILPTISKVIKKQNNKYRLRRPPVKLPTAPSASHLEYLKTVPIEHLRIVGLSKLAYNALSMAGINNAYDFCQITKPTEYRNIGKILASEIYYLQRGLLMLDTQTLHEKIYVRCKANQTAI